MTPQQTLNNEILDSEDVVTELDISHLVIEDDTPVDNFQSAQQQRLLVEPLYSNRTLPSPFIADANVGLFYELKGEPIVPDVLLSLGVQRAADYSKRRDRSYFVWEFGKVPEVCIEIVSNQEGDELALSKKSQRQGKTRSKQEIYAQVGARYYVVFDPLKQIQGPHEMAGACLRMWMLTGMNYREITSSEGLVEVGQWLWLEDVGVGLTLWEGQFEEDVMRLWLRWCDRDGQVIPTGAEGQAMAQQQAVTERQRADAEQERADAEQQRAERLAERLRTMGIDPDEV
ncbi:MAG: Uma2 family endonuclease [Cyanobacteria bacterium P01_H01_bin.121]